MTLSKDLLLSIGKYLICFALGFFVCFQFFPRTVEKIEYKDKVVQVPTIKEIPVKGEKETSIVYVERASNDNAQLDLTTNAPNIVARVNGKDFTFENKVDEKYAFEKGQLKVTQTSNVTIDAQQILDHIQAEERIKHQEQIKQEKNKANRRFLQGIYQGALVGYGLSKLE